MKILYRLLLISLLTTPAYGQRQNPRYDSTLAHQLGADEYGMKNYIFVILKSGDNQSADRHFRDSCFAGHLKNIGRLAEDRKLIVAGPFGDNNQDFRGLFILNVATVQEAQQLLETDPAIQAHFLKPELYPWYGSAALPEYLDASDKVWKKRF